MDGLESADIFLLEGFRFDRGGGGLFRLDGSGITEPIGKALFDAGYASEDNFTAPCAADLYVAVTRDSAQAAGHPGGSVPVVWMVQGWPAVLASSIGSNVLPRR